MNSNKTRNSIKVKTIGNYLENKYRRMWAIYSPVKNVYISEGKEIDANDFELMYPLTLDRNAINKGKHLDSRAIL